MPALPSIDAACPSRPARRSFLQHSASLGAGLALAPAAVLAADDDAWTATWGAAPVGPPTSANALSFSNQTLRLVVRASLGGHRLRVRLSNEFGSTPLQIGAAWIGIVSSWSSLVAGSNTQLSFAGRPGAVIPPGAPLLSDPVDFPLPPQADLAVSLYLPGNVVATSVHDAAFQLNYASSAGNYAASNSLPVARNLYAWPFLTEIDVASNGGATCLVALGDSQTDGMLSSGSANRRWPDFLARRLQAEALPGSVPVGVVNRGICGNRLLLDADNAPLAGRDCMERFDRDVLAIAGARYLAVLVGINDIINTPSSSLSTLADELIAGYVQLIARARTRGMLALGATLLPYEGYVWYSAARDQVRQRVNNWIRNSGAFDAVLDFEAAVRDPAWPTRLLAAYDGGDHLHPSDAGYEAMARAVPLALFGY